MVSISGPTEYETKRPRRRRNAVAIGTATLVVAALALSGCTGSSSKTTKSSGSSGSSGSSSAVTAGNSGSAGSGFPDGADISGETILAVIYTTPLSAWQSSLNSFKAVTATTGMKVEVQYANNKDATEISQIQAGISRKVAGMALQITSNAVAGAVCAAAKAGIPVIAWNQNGLTGASKSCVQATIDEDFVAAGNVIGKFMIAKAGLKQGAKVFCPVEDPTAVYAAQRAQGVNQALSAIGSKCDVLATGDADADAKTKMVQYLLGHKNTAAIIALGGIPLSNGPAALTQVNSKAPLGGFDLYDPRIPTAISQGKILGVVDQQFYSQSFYAAQQLALELKYGLFPSDMNTSGSGVFDKSNIALVLKLSGKYR
jgi:simple sugar transport system substrate-binding protein